MTKLEAIVSATLPKLATSRRVSEALRTTDLWCKLSAVLIIPLSEGKRKNTRNIELWKMLNIKWLNENYNERWEKAIEIEERTRRKLRRNNGKKTIVKMDKSNVTASALSLKKNR